MRSTMASLLFGLLLVSTFGFAVEPAEDTVSPAQLYKMVHLMVQQKYVDPSFNGQDWDIWSLERRYRGKLNDYEDAGKAIDTMLASLDDKYTRFLDREEYQDELRAISAKLTGVGIQIGLNQEKKVVVISPIQDTPAFRAGLQPKDEIIAVDGKSTTGLSIEEVAKRIRGKPGTEVVLTISRDGETMEVPITRAEIEVASVPNGHARVLEDDICYLHLTSFISKNATEEVAKEIGSLETRASGECAGLIFDLRNNPGGLLDNAINISSIFLDDGRDIVSTVDRNGYVYTRETDKAEAPYDYDGPMVVLVNAGSASASEILSGALRDHGRAELVGETTFGKGLVQAVRELPNGSGINLTTAKYLTPDEVDIHEIGIKPSHEVKLSKQELKDGLGPWFTDFQKVVDPDSDLTSDRQLEKARALMKDMLGSQQAYAVSR